jgi:nucleoside phosphorylase
MAEEAKYEVIILCATTNEQKFVTEHFDKVFSRIKHFEPVYQTAPNLNSTANLLVMNCGEMGNISAASMTGHILGSYKPNLVIFVGTAGSLDPTKYNIGDVVVPELGAQTLSYNKIVDFEDEKFKAFRDRKLIADIWPHGIDGTEYAFRHDDAKGNIALSRRSRDIISKARENIDAAPELGTLLESHDLNQNPKIHYDVQVFSWEKVVASDRYRKKLNIQFAKAAIVDMESYGFLHAGRQYQESSTVRAIIVRGISDLCGQKSTKFRDDYAVKNASIVAAEIVKRGYMNL